MVSKKDIQSLDFKTIEEYFDYIVNSKINGNYNQANELFNDLSKTQKKDFIDWLQMLEYSSEDIIEILEYVNHY
jgi:DNA polymerase III delta subunit